MADLPSTEYDAAASEDSSQSLVSPRQWEAASLCNRSFERAGEFEAYHDCERWLYEQGCSIGSMQRAAPIGVMFEPGHSIAKSRNLGADAADMHGWITFPGGVGPRNLPLPCGRHSGWKKPLGSFISIRRDPR